MPRKRKEKVDEEEETATSGVTTRKRAKADTNEAETKSTTRPSKEPITDRDDSKPNGGRRSTRMKKKIEEDDVETPTKKNNVVEGKRAKKTKATDPNSKKEDEEMATAEPRRKPSTKPKPVRAESEESESESEWEDVADHPGPMEPKEDEPGTSKSIQITVNAPKTKKEVDVEGELRRALKRFKKELQENLHKAHLLSFIAYGRRLSIVCNEELNRSVALSMIPVGYTQLSYKTMDEDQLKRFVKWFRSGFTMADENAPETELVPHDLALGIRRNLQTRVAFSHKMLVLCFVTTARSMGFDARIVFSAHPISRKMEGESNTPSESVTKKKNTSANKKAIEKTSPAQKPDAIPAKKASRKSGGRKRVKKDSTSGSGSDDSEWEASEEDEAEKKRKSKPPAPNRSKSAKDSDKQTPRGSKVRGKKGPSSKSSEDAGSELSIRTDRVCEYWAEVYLEKSNKWICVNCVDGSVDDTDSVKEILSYPVIYCLAFDKDLALKDVTGRYASDFMSSQTRRARMDQDWLQKTFDLFRTKDRIRNRLEDMQLEAALSKRSLPTAMNDYKNHPLYVLKRDLKKFEGIYPEDMKAIGFFRNEAVYPRSAVHTLHSKDTWRKEALSVREGQEPYKVVKGRPKYDSATKKVIDDREVAVYGRWQTEPYRAPAAKDGIVPRNEYGNVYMFKASMVPPGTVHLRLPGLLSVARKMDVDCAPAMTGWDFHGRASHPVLDGWVVCEEYKDALVAAWEEDQAVVAAREQERRSNKAVHNWRRLIKAMLVREKLRRKFKQHPQQHVDQADSGSTSAKVEEEKKAETAKKEETGEGTSKEKMVTRNRVSWPQCRREFTASHHEEL